MDVYEYTLESLLYMLAAGRRRRAAAQALANKELNAKLVGDV